nr:MAG TPA: hypothetical protein [Caudoviricetes sp.]
MVTKLKMVLLTKKEVIQTKNSLHPRETERPP